MDIPAMNAMAERLEIPAPEMARQGGWFRPPLWIAPRIALYRVMQNAGISNNELARRLGMREGRSERAGDGMRAVFTAVPG